MHRPLCVRISIVKHRFSLCSDRVRVAERRLDFVGNDLAHGEALSSTLGVEEHKFFLDLFLREGSHRLQLLEKPLVCLAQLSQLECHVLLADNLNDQVAQTFVQFYAVLHREARLKNDSLLVVRKSAPPYLLLVHVEGLQTHSEFPEHLVVFQTSVLNEFLLQKELF